MNMKNPKKGEKGLTLLELIIAIAITSLITGGIGTIVYQIYTGSTRSANHMVAVREVQDAGYWLSEYAYSAQNATITGGSGFPLILQWVNFEPSGKHKVVFNLTSSSGGLRGSYYVDSGGGYVLDSARTGKIPVFQFIDSNITKTNCQVSGGSAFSLPDVNNDVFKIIGGATNDSGTIFFPGGKPSSDPIATGNATRGAWDSNSKSYPWAATAGGTITVTATSANTKGSWTSETRAATAAITVDSDGDATLSSARGLVFTITATVGAGRNAASETRIYKVIPKPVS
jgi:prepilin-type N-terminal cleavage/methylation domain-containing protein